MNVNQQRFATQLKNPTFCFIAPTQYLTKYATNSTTHLILAHLVDSDDQYTQFYNERSVAGDRIIMDCSAFELGQSYDPDKLIELGVKCNAHALVLPDYPGQPATKTIDSAIKYGPMFRDAGFAVMYVPQSRKGDTKEWIDAYKWGATSDLVDIVGMSILGIPNALPHIPAAYARVVMTQMLIDRNLFNFNKHHHYLGLNSAPNVELPSLIKMNALDTCDSSNPVWTGINSIKYDTLATDFMYPSKKYLRHVNFNEPLVSDRIHNIIQYNVDITLDIFNNPDKYI